MRKPSKKISKKSVITLKKAFDKIYLVGSAWGQIQNSVKSQTKRKPRELTFSRG